MNNQTTYRGFCIYRFFNNNRTIKIKTIDTQSGEMLYYNYNQVENKYSLLAYKFIGVEACQQKINEYHNGIANWLTKHNMTKD